MFVRKIINLFFCSVALFAASVVLAQNGQEAKTTNYPDLQWKQIATGMPEGWYGSDEAMRVADSVMKYQTEIGGWPKNSDFHKNVDRQEMARIMTTGIGATFDNGATITEMVYLAKIYSRIKDERYRESFMRGFEYILKAQYPNGGWPQFYPHRKGRPVDYARHITYNDDAMVNVMRFLSDMANENAEYAHLRINAELSARAQEAFDRGVECILKTQIVVDGTPTVWCAQHDEVTLAPAKARAYELPSFSGSESAGITILLMDIGNPTQEIIRAVSGAVKWFENNEIEGIKVDTEIDKEGRKNRIVVKDKNAPAIWARFYDLETVKPFFCDRDGVKKETLAEIGYERRNGYSWYTNSPAKVLKRYPDWAKKWEL